MEERRQATRQRKDPISSVTQAKVRLTRLIMILQSNIYLRARSVFGSFSST